MLIENCNISGINPYTCLADTPARRAACYPDNAVGDLMPWIAEA